MVLHFFVFILGVVFHIYDHRTVGKVYIARGVITLIMSVDKPQPTYRHIAALVIKEVQQRREKRTLTYIANDAMKMVNRILALGHAWNSRK